MEGKMELARTCPCCGKKYILFVDMEKWKRWIKGELIQNAFPELKPIQREQMITGICSDECWEAIFK